MARSDVAPARCISRMIGTTLAACRFAFASMTSTAALRAWASLGPPSLTPRALARDSASRVRCAVGRRAEMRPPGRGDFSFGPKDDGTYVVEFRTAAGEALAISIPRTEAGVIRHFQERMPYGLFVPDVP
jgi:hypothetical protein